MRRAARGVRLLDESPLARQVDPGDPIPVRARSRGSAGDENQLLARLPPEVIGPLAPYLDRAHLERQHVLFRAQEPLTAVYFPDTAVVSLVSRLASGQALEVGLVGWDGIVGTALLPGVVTTTYDAIVLELLVDNRFLVRTKGDLYARLTEGSIAIPAFRMSKASLDRSRAGGSDRVPASWAHGSSRVQTVR